MIKTLTIFFTTAAAVLSSFFNNDVYSRYESLPDVVEAYFGSADADCHALAKEGRREEKHILVFETTDLHGYLFDASSGDPGKFQYRLAYISNEVNKARNSDEYDDVILLDGGDIYQGTPFSSLTGGAPLRLAFETMGYDAVVSKARTHSGNIHHY